MNFTGSDLSYVDMGGANVQGGIFNGHSYGAKMQGVGGFTPTSEIAICDSAISAGHIWMEQ